MINVGIIEKKEGLRFNLSNFLNKQEEMNCILVAPSIESFFQERNPHDSFDVVLHEIEEKGEQSFRGIKKLKISFPKAEVISFSSREDSECIMKSIYAGATGYLVKGTPLSKIKEAILEAYKGSSALSPAVARKLIEYFSPKATIRLTPKENQIVDCLTNGCSYKVTADKLSISINTLNFHIKNLYKKLGVNSKTEVVAMRLKGEC